MMTTTRQRTIAFAERAGFAVVDENAGERSPVRIRTGVPSKGLVVVAVHDDAAKDAAISFFPGTNVHMESKHTDYMFYKASDRALDFEVRDDDGLIAEIWATLPAVLPFDLIDGQSEFDDFDPSAEIVVAVASFDEIGKGMTKLLYACLFVPKYRAAPEEVVIALARAFRDSHATEEDTAAFITALDSAALVGNDHRQLVSRVFRREVNGGPVLEQFVDPDHASEIRAVLQMLARGRNPLAEFVEGRIKGIKAAHSP